MAAGSPRRWWPALDGLRGLAVLAVLAYHVDKTLVPGGFLGVSCFFTISGFLIVGQLVEERDRTGRVDLARFWSRRLRRLAPAFSVTVVATVLAVAISDPGSVRRVAGDALAGIGYVANWHDLLDDVGYAERFGRGAEPLAHLWSLSIEEQVYLLVPLAVGWWGVRRAGWAAAALVVAGVALWWGSTDAYFATPVRLGEVAAGAWLGVRLVRGAPPPRPLARAGGPALVVAAVSLVAVSDTDDWLFRGGLPAVALLWLALIAGSVGQGRVARVLAVAPLRWFGTRSYAIYLFHVPLLELTDLSAVEVVAVTLLLAEVSHRMVESPVRRGGLRAPVLAAASAATAVVVVTVAAVAQPDPVDVTDAIAAALEPEGAPGAASSGPSVSGSPISGLSSRASGLGAAEGAAAGVSRFVDPSPPAPPPTTPAPAPAADPGPVRVLSVGDSTGRSVGEALDAYLAAHDSELVDRTVEGCSPLFTVEQEWGLRFDRTPEGEVPAGYCRASVADALAETGPVDVVVMLDHGMVLADHRAEGTDTWVSVADDVLGDALLERYARWADQTAAAGAVLVLATAPAPVPGTTPDEAVDDPAERIAAHNEVVRRVAERSPESIVVIDLAEAVTGDPARYSRTDGVHYDHATGAVHLVVDHLGPAVMAAGA